MKTRDIIITVAITNIVSILAVIFIISIFRSNQPDVQKEPTVPAPKVSPAPVEPAVPDKPSVDKDQILALFESRTKIQQKKNLESFAKVMRDVPPYPGTGMKGYPITVALNGEYEKAEQLAKDEIRNYPETANSYYMLVWIYARVGNYDGAIKMCQEVLPRGGAFNDLRYIMAWVYARQQRYDDALKICDDAILNAPYSRDLFYAKGRILDLLERNDDAIASYSRAIELKKDFSEAYLFRGLLYAKMGRYEEAINDQKQTILVNKYDREGYLALGLIYDQTGNFEAAREQLNNAIMLGSLGTGPDPSKQRLASSVGIDDAAIYNRIGILNIKLGLYQEAISAFNKATVSEPGSADSSYGLTLTYLLLGDKKSAVENYQKLKRLSPELAGSIAAIVEQN